MTKAMVKAVMVGLTIVGIVFIVLGLAMANGNPACHEPCGSTCPDCVCPSCPDCVCKPSSSSCPKCPEFPECPDVTCPEIPDCSLACPDPCPNPCGEEVDTSGSYLMLGIGGEFGEKPEVVVGTLTIYPGEKVGIAYQCLTVGRFSNIGCTAYLLKKK